MHAIGLPGESRLVRRNCATNFYLQITILLSCFGTARFPLWDFPKWESSLLAQPIACGVHVKAAYARRYPLWIGGGQ